MNPFRLALLTIALLPAVTLRAVEHNVRVAVVIDMTADGRKVAHPTPENPSYYVPVVLGYKELGDILTDFQRPPPPTYEIQRLLTKALAEQGYRVANPQSPPSLVLVFRWGSITPQIVNGRFVNRDEMMTYLVGENWREMQGALDPQTTELLSEVDNSVNLESSAPHHGQGNPYGEPVDMGSATHEGARYYLMVSALDYQASRQHKSVLLWRAHVSINYWGHYLDDTLPVLIMAAAPYFGLQTLRPVITTEAALPHGQVTAGTPVMKPNLPETAGTIAIDRLQADTEQRQRDFTARSQAGMMSAPGAPIIPTLAPPPPAADISQPGTRQGDASSRVVRLPPFIVSDSASRIHWRYAAIPGFEFLSAVPNQDTDRFAVAVFLERRWLDEILSPDLGIWNAVPTTIILLDNRNRQEMSDRIAALAREGAGETRERLARAGVVAGDSVTLIPQVKLQDEDSTGVDIMLRPEDSFEVAGRTNVHPSNLGFDPDFVFTLLENRAPRLPQWFTVGASLLWLRREEANAAWKPNQNGSPLAQGLGFNHFSTSEGQILHFPPFNELPEKAKLLPLRELLAGPPGPGTTEDGFKKADIWRGEAMLLVRWALDDGSYSRRRALWALAEREADGAPAPDLFKQCFGLSPEWALDLLQSYRETATYREMSFIPREPMSTPWIDPEDPTEDQLSRILGDWQRKEVDFIKPHSARIAGRYATQAQETLMRAYDEGSRDPGLLAAIGLYECSVGDDRQAVGYLEEAVRAGVARPRAYVDLARIRLLAALSHPDGKGDRLDRAQATAILAPLQSVRAADPPQLKAYLLAAETWERSDFIPSSSELGLLADGIHYFPGDPRLVLAAAQLDKAAGLTAEAIRVIDRGLAEISNPRMRGLLTRLRARYAAGNI